MDVLDSFFQIIIALPRNVFNCYSIFSNTLEFIGLSPLSMFNAALTFTITTFIGIHLIRLFI